MPQTAEDQNAREDRRHASAMTLAHPEIRPLNWVRLSLVEHWQASGGRLPRGVELCLRSAVALAPKCHVHELLSVGCVVLYAPVLRPPGILKGPSTGYAVLSLPLRLGLSSPAFRHVLRCGGRAAHTLWTPPQNIWHRRSKEKSSTYRQSAIPTWQVLWKGQPWSAGCLKGGSPFLVTA
jgi:hypothetical protein